MQPLRLPARVDNLPIFRQLVLDEATRAGLDEASRQRVELVLEEALMNILHHAYPQSETGAPTKPMVELFCGTGPEGVFYVTLTDWGLPFDPVAAAQKDPDPDAVLDGSPTKQEAALHVNLEANLTADLEHRAPGGMGLFLISNMSRASYARIANANVLTLQFPQIEDAVDIGIPQSS